MNVIRLCRMCGKNPAREAKTCCEGCAARFSEWGKRSYRSKKERKLCGAGGCPNAAAAKGVLCLPCKQKRAAQRRARDQARREEGAR